MPLPKEGRSAVVARGVWVHGMTSTALMEPVCESCARYQALSDASTCYGVDRVPGIYDACALEGSVVHEDGAGLSVTRVSAL